MKPRVVMRTWIIAGVAALGVVSAGHAEMYATDAFAKGTTRPASIAILLPSVVIVKQRVMRNEPQIEETVALADQLALSMQETLSARGYTVRLIGPQMIGGDAELRKLVSTAGQRSADILEDAGARPPPQFGKLRYNGGDEMRLLAAKLGVDAIAFGELQIAAPTAGSRAVITRFRPVSAGPGRKPCCP